MDDLAGRHVMLQGARCGGCGGTSAGRSAKRHPPGKREGREGGTTSRGKVNHGLGWDDGIPIGVAMKRHTQYCRYPAARGNEPGMALVNVEW